MLVLRRRRWTPKRVPGIQAWYAASRITGLSDGATISQWNDLSGNANHLTQATGSNQPTYKTNLGFPVARFDANRWMDKASFVLAQPFTVFVTAKTDDKVALYAALGSVTNIQHPAIFAVSATGLPRAGTIGSNLTAAGGDWSAAFGVTVGIYNGASSEIWFNNANHAAGALDAKDFINLRVGRNFTGNAWLGDIASILIYSRSLSTSERQRIQTFCGAEVNVTI